MFPANLLRNCLRERDDAGETITVGIPASRSKMDTISTRETRFLRAVTYVLRVIAGLFIIGLLLQAASRTTRDCTVGLYVFDICSWVWLREQLGLPASKFLRAGFLELVGLALTTGI